MGSARLRLAEHCIEHLCSGPFGTVTIRPEACTPLTFSLTRRAATRPFRIMPKVFGWLLVPVGVYLAVAAFLFFMQERMVFVPTAGTPGATPADVGLDFQEVWLTSADGTQLHGWWVPGAMNGHVPRGTVLFCHGNAGNIGNRLDTLRIIHELGLSSLFFDYRGYGLSEGRPSETGINADAMAGWDWLVANGVPPQHIVIWGRSLGGAVGAILAARVGGRTADGATVPAALVVESAFTSLPDLAAQLYPWLPARYLARIDFDARKALAQVRCPVLVLHGPDDEVVPFSHGRELFANARNPKIFQELTGGHNDGFLTSGVVYTNALRQFLSAHLP